MPAHILVIDDSELMTELAAEFLEQAGFRVSAVNDPQLAMLEIETGRPDLVVLDVDMPGLSGLDILRMVREAPAHAALPVIMMTAHGKTHRIVASFGQGASDYIFKPYDGRDLVGRVHRALEVKKAA